MEIDITELFEKDTWPFSGSVATHGPDAGKSTWCSALHEAAESPLLRDEDALDAMRQWAKETGAWTREEIAAWSAEECNALFIQLVTGDLRESGLEEAAIDDDELWAEYEAGANDGRWSGNLYRHEGRVFYSLSN